jgi:hypothetical protein
MLTIIVGVERTGVLGRGHALRPYSLRYPDVRRAPYICVPNPTSYMPFLVDGYALSVNHYL